jgi:nucleoside-diphosphate-sugar epimerase
LKNNSKLLILGGTSSFAGELINNAKNKNYEVIASFREPSKVPEKSEIELFQLDVQHLKSIEKFLTQIDNYKFSRIVCLMGSLSEIHSINSYKVSARYIETYVTNLVYLLDNLLLANRAESNCKILIVSSRAAKYGSYDYHYAIAKAAMEAYVKSKSKSTPQVQINALSLGLVKGSKMFNEMPIEVSSSHEKRTNYKLLTVPEVAIEIIDIFDRSAIDSGTTIYFGPQYE